MVAGILIGLAVGDLDHCSAQDFARARLGQAVHHHGQFECGHRPDLVAYQFDAFGINLCVDAPRRGVEAHEANRHLSLKLVRHADHRTFGHVRVPREDLFHSPCREAVACHIDHVIGARHDVEVAVLVDHARVARFIIAREGSEVAFLEPLLGIPQRGQGARGQRQFHAIAPSSPAGNGWPASSRICTS